ncbi:MAG: hypothetical protein SynsKO_03450 [Synoicihabitans sp.]
MSKSTKSKTPAAPRVKKTAAPKKAVVKKAAAAKTPAAPAKKKSAPAKAKAPAKKAAVKKATPVKKAVAPKKAVAKKPAAKPAVTKKVVAKKAPAKKAPAKKKAAAKKTLITAKIDIAFGNTLFVRGEGPGLSWDAGVPMNSVDADTWSLEIAGAKSQVIFKFLVNDITWNIGEDYVVDAGGEVSLIPTF